MTRLEKYDVVNKTQSLEELAKVIESFADADGLIQGRSRKFNAKRMAENCRFYDNELHNTLTRDFGIRQQALYFLFYSKL